MASKIVSNHWSSALIKEMNNSKIIIAEDDHVVMIKDKYPKAEHHYLVLPKMELKGLSNLDSSHLGLVKHMSLFANREINKLIEEDKSYIDFQLGFHAVPSMQQLHMHVISKDFNSPSLKTLKHWNSFTTPFFILDTEIIKLLECLGTVKLDKMKYEAMLKLPITCPRCKKQLEKMPQLKEHIIKCLI